MAIHRIHENFLTRLIARTNINFNLEEIEQDIQNYWNMGENEPTREIMFVITLNELRTILNRNGNTELGVCISNLTARNTVRGRWLINPNGCGENDDFFVLNHQIARFWVDDTNVNDMCCIAARLAYNEDRTIPYYVYFHRGEIHLNQGEGTGGEDLATGVRVPSH